MRTSWPGCTARGWDSTFATCYDYLTRVLSYDLGEPELAGLEPIRRDGRPPGPGPGRSEPCLPPSPRSCSAPLTAAA